VTSKCVLSVWAALLLPVAQAAARQNAAGGLPEELQRRLTAPAHYSLSKQFVIYDEEEAGWLPTAGSGADIVRLEPNLLSVSCERIKRALLKKLGLTQDEWRGRIMIHLHPAESLDEGIQLVSQSYPDGWTYQMDLPDTMEGTRLVAAMTQVLLLEMANRNSKEHSAEIPTWLVQGMTQELTLEREVELVLHPPEKMEGGVTLGRLDRSERLTSSLVAAHAELQNVAPLTLEELSWPSDEQFTGQAGAVYRSSAQLLVCDLLGLADGRARLLDFLADLPQHLNWQIAFLDAFHNHFATQRDFEKWWAVETATFTGRDLSRALSPAESWQRLEQVVHPHVEIRAGGDGMPMRTEASLQTVLTDMDYAQQTEVLRAKAKQFMMLRLQVAPEFVALAWNYQRVLENSLDEMQRASIAPLVRGVRTPSAANVTRDTIRQLDALDAWLAELRPPPEASKEPATNDVGVTANP
jgi:hypothetical protein